VDELAPGSRTRQTYHTTTSRLLQMGLRKLRGHCGFFGVGGSVEISEIQQVSVSLNR
jgi:hypothetical protein